MPVYSLYSETREPTAEMLRGLDVLVIDLQDIGTRIYTYIYTMANCLRAARAARRPGHRLRPAEPDRRRSTSRARLLEPGYESFVGQFPIPMRHGMTIGELARLFNEHFGIGAALDVVPMEGWRATMYPDETGLPWVMPSPNIPTLDSAIVYPGTVLFEGTLLSEGRGTTRPFELVGAPWIDGERFARRDERARPAGRATSGRRSSSRRSRSTRSRRAAAARFTCPIARAFRPVLTGVALMAEFRRQDPARFPWRQPPYEYEHDKLPIDILYGSDRLRATLDAGEDVGALVASWDADEEAFRRGRNTCLSRVPDPRIARSSGRVQVRLRRELIRFFAAASLASRICRACLCAWSA